MGYPELDNRREPVGCSGLSRSRKEETRVQILTQPDGSLDSLGPATSSEPHLPHRIIVRLKKKGELCAKS